MVTSNNTSNLLDFLKDIAYQNESKGSHLCKAIALAEVAMSKGFLEQDNVIQYNYLWALRDLLKEADELNDQQLATLMGKLKTIGLAQN